VYAVDPHEGTVGCADGNLYQGGPTLQRFEHNIAKAGLVGTVQVIQRRSTEVDWRESISFLYLDGLHDYASVRGDVAHFGPWLRQGAYVGFHDYADYYPGVKAVVDELLGTHACALVERVQSLAVLQLVSSAMFNGHRTT
jgi:hypothetical protein